MFPDNCRDYNLNQSYSQVRLHMYCLRAGLEGSRAISIYNALFTAALYAEITVRIILVNAVLISLHSMHLLFSQTANS